MLRAAQLKGGDRMSYASMLEKVEIFDELGRDRLERVSDICVEHRYEQGDHIFEQLDASDGLYIILSGEVDILIDQRSLAMPGGAPAPVPVARLRRGQSFGEVALVDKGVRTATARAAAPDTRLLMIRRDDLMELCREDCELGFALMRNLAGDLALKIRQTDMRMR
jgi:CRP/FNR family transcriptional regulator, cyclic AMP receptor protein